jgi:DUF4097 and DUF4098 domain-containing protein YvlB
MIRPGLRASVLVIALFAAAGATAGCDMNVGAGDFHIGLASGRAADTWSKTWTVAAGTRFELRNTNGGITVQPAPAGASLEVKAERTARSSTDEAARELLKKIEIHAEASPGRVLVETRAPKTWGRDGQEVKYTVLLPDGVSLDVQNTNGGIEVRGVSGAAAVRTTNGGIKAEGLKGQLEARTTNGGITVGLAAVPGAVSLETVNGGISLEVPAATAADLSAHVTNGGIHVDDALKFQAVGDQNRRNVAGKLNGGGTKIEASTTNGGIHVSAR